MEIQENDIKQSQDRISKLYNEIDEIISTKGVQDKQDQLKKISKIGSEIERLKNDKWNYGIELERLLQMRSKSNLPNDVKDHAVQEYLRINLKTLNQKLSTPKIEQSTIRNSLKKMKGVVQEFRQLQPVNNELKNEIRTSLKLLKPHLNNKQELIKNDAQEIFDKLSKNIQL